MNDDIVTRLRKQYVGNYNALLWDEAADEIEQLRKELDTRIAMCDMHSKRIIELEGLIDSALEADHNNEYFRTHHK
ncbi:hypothetical protein EBT25_09495 [bacterium]|nr:hypothetical protein [bacterium]